MPVMNGTEAVLKLRDLGYNGIILGVTGNALPEDVQEFENKGADLVIVKPLDVTKFEDAIKQVKTKRKISQKTK